MVGHSHSKNGVASLAYVPAIHAFTARSLAKDVDARHEGGHDDQEARGSAQSAAARRFKAWGYAPLLHDGGGRLARQGPGERGGRSICNLLRVVQ